MPGGIVFIGVTFAADELAVRFARQLAPCTGIGVTTIVVDNEAGTDGSRLASRIHAVSPQAHCLGFGRNLGYFGAAAAAYGWAVSNVGAPRWTVVSNVDVDLDCVAFVRHLQSRDVPPGAAVLAPAIVSRATGLDQNPHLLRRPSGARMRFYRWVSGSFRRRQAYEALSRFGRQCRKLTRRWLRLPSARQESTGQHRRIYAPHGSCIVFAQEYFAAGGSLDYSGFLFGEEIFVGEFCRRRALEVHYVPELRVLHAEHVSTGAAPTREIAAHAATSAEYLAREFFGRRS